MPSLANKKVALVAQDVTNAVASTEFLVLRKKPNADINLYYLFRALRSDHFTRQAVANVTGDTGRQRITPAKLLDFKIIVPPKELQDKIGIEVEKEFTLRTLACEQAKLVEDEAAAILGRSTLRTEKLASNATKRIKK
jgi:type I restriction enzyme S subunit